MSYTPNIEGVMWFAREVWPQVRRARPDARLAIVGADPAREIRTLANDLHRLNHAVMKAVEAGVSVELVRSARHHGGDGNWGDLLIPVVVAKSGFAPED